MKKQQISRWIVIALIVILIGTIIYLTKPQGLPTGAVIKKPEKEPIRIGLVVWPGFGPFYLAKEKGFFEKNGANVELVTVDSTIWKTVMKLGQVDAEPVTPDMIQLYVDEGIPLVSIMGIDYSYGGDGIVATKDIKEIKDLRGKKIAFERGSISHYFLLYLLDKEGLTSNDITPIDMPVSDAAAAFASGKVDAAVTWEPWLSTVAKKRKESHVLISSKQTPKLIPTLLSFRKEVLNERSEEEIKGVMKGWFETLEYMEKYPEESNRIMARSLGLSNEEFLKIKSNIRWFNYNESKEFFGTTEEPGQVFEVINIAGEIWLKEGLIKKKTNASDVINFSYLEEFNEYNE